MIFGINGVSRVLPFRLMRQKTMIGMKMYSTEASSQYIFKTLAVTKPSDYVFHVELNRPEKLNTFNKDAWREIGVCFSSLGEDSDCRAIVLSGRGKMFTAGIDLSDLTEMTSIVTGDDDIAKKCRTLKNLISKYQDSLSSLEKCPKPVIAAIHGPCIGGGVDLICSADIRYCSADAWFQVKEVDVGLAADVGTLQRLPKIVGSESLVRELCFTARKFFASEAEKTGFVSRVFQDNDTLIAAALELASNIAEKSPVAVQTTKAALIHARDHSVQEGLDFLATINMSLLQSQDLMIAAMATMKKEKPIFAKL